MTAKNLKPEDAKAMQAAEVAEPDFEDMEFTASTEVREIPQELKQPSAGAATPGNVVQINKPTAAAQPAPRPAAPAAPQAPLPTNVLELQNRMKMMDMQQQAQLKLVEQTVTEILINIKQKSQSIDQDIMRIKKILDSLNVKK